MMKAIQKVVDGFMLACPLAFLIALHSQRLFADEDSTNPLRGAIEKGLVISTRGADNYPNHRQCFSCHHQTLPVLAMVEGRKFGVAIDNEVLQSQVDFTYDSFNERVENMNQGKGIGGKAFTVGYGLWTLNLVHREQDATTTAMVNYLLLTQTAEGKWIPHSIRPPLEESEAMCTTLAAYYLGEFATEEQRAAADKAIQQAHHWVSESKPKSQEDWNAKLWSTSFFDQDEEKVNVMRQKVMTRQRPDGGWSQLTEMESDAYATGQTLYILRATGSSPQGPELQRGLQFLLQSQHKDGSWFVKSRSKAIQEIFDNGDPHGDNQFISIAATGWAVSALAAIGELSRDHE